MRRAHTYVPLLCAFTVTAMMMAPCAARADAFFSKINSNDAAPFSTHPDAILWNVARCYMMADQSTTWWCYTPDGNPGVVVCDSQTTATHWEFLDFGEDERGTTHAGINLEIDGQSAAVGWVFYGPGRGGFTYADYYPATIDAGTPGHEIATCTMWQRMDGALLPLLATFSR